MSSSHNHGATYKSTNRLAGTIDKALDAEVARAKAAEAALDLRLKALEPVIPPIPPPSTGYPPDTTLKALALPAIPALPGLLTPAPTGLGTNVTRIANAGARNVYSRKDAWNSDGSRLLLGWDDGRPKPLLDGNTYAVVNPNLSVPGYAQWAHTDPNRIYGTSNNNPTLRAIDIRTGAEVYAKTFPFSEVSLGDGEGTISDDDKTIVLMTKTPTGIIVVDVPSGAILASKTFTTRPNNATISRKGNYVLVSFGPDGPGTEQGMWVYSRSLTNPRQLRTQARHGDPGLLADGRECWVQCSPEVESFDLATGAVTRLLVSNSAFVNGHVSCRNLDWPGWAFLSNYQVQAGQLGADQLVAVNLDGSGTVKVYGFANHRDTVYEHMPFAVPSRDGKRVLFGSEWGTTSVYAFVAGAA